MDVSEVDLADGPRFHQWYEAVREVWLDAWPGDPPWAGEPELHELFTDEEETKRILFVGKEPSGDVVGVAEVGFPQRENLHVADVEVSVRPTSRQHGYGRALLEAAESCAFANGRSVLLSNTYGRAATIESRDARFAAAAGFHHARTEVRRELRLPLEPELATQLDIAQSSALDSYRLISWWNRCPDELVESRVRLAWTLSADEPRGDLDIEDEQFDVDRIRWWERHVATTGRELACTGAVSTITGELVAVTEIGMPRKGDDLAEQFITVVDRAHRGHRLGMLVKLANLQLAVERGTPLRRVCTWNGETNGPMIRVNEELGFTIVGKAFNWQKSS